MDDLSQSVEDGEAGVAEQVTAAKPKRTRAPKGTSSFNMAPKSEVKTPRGGTKRATVVHLVTREGGATLEEIMQETGWEKKTAYEGVRLVNQYVGYGLRTDPESGKITGYLAEAA